MNISGLDKDTPFVFPSNGNERVNFRVSPGAPKGTRFVVTADTEDFAGYIPSQGVIEKQDENTYQVVRQLGEPQELFEFVATKDGSDVAQTHTVTISVYSPTTNDKEDEVTVEFRG